MRILLLGLLALLLVGWSPSIFVMIHPAPLIHPAPSPTPKLCDGVTGAVLPLPEDYWNLDINGRMMIDSAYWHLTAGMGDWCDVFGVDWVKNHGCLVSKSHPCKEQDDLVTVACTKKNHIFYKTGISKVYGYGESWHERFCGRH